MNESHRETGATAHRTSSVVTGVTRKVIVSAAVGSFVLAVSAFSDQSLVDGLLLSILIGGIVLLVQFLSDFEHRLDKLEESQRVGLERVNDATQLYSKAELSPLSTTRIKLLVDRAGQLDRDTSPLLLSLAGVQLERVSRLLKNILEHHEEAADAVTYDGEDRDWLLDLTDLATDSIDAVSLSTVDAGVSSFDGGLWGSDLGRRYLEKQSEATDRGVRIRRLFYFDNPLVSADESFRTLCLHQDAAGIEVRVLGEGMGNVSQRLRARIFDFIVFDRQLMYEMQSVQRVQRGVPPETFTTRLAGSPNRVGDLCRRFDELWAAAETPSWLPEPKVNGAALPRPVAPVEDEPATDSAAG